MKPYPEYKDTNIDWLGNIPSHWGTVPLKYVCYMKGRIGWQGLTQAEFTDEGPFLITGMNFKNGRMNWDECYHISKERYAEAPEIHVRQGDILITKDGTIGKLLFMEYLPGPTSLNSHLLILRPRNDEFVSKYLYYLLHSGVFLRYVDNVKTGTTFFGITQASMGDFRMLIFDKTEQQAIADFLDRKTAQIDTLIAKKQRQIDLLQEQRTALINQAVTKGLNPSAPMKDSGVEWLGKIPSHWEVKPLKHVAILNREVLPEQTPKEYEIRYIDISSVNNIGKIEEPKTMTFSEAPSRARRIIKKNDIIISTVRTYLKTVAIIESEEVNLVASTGFATLTAKKGIEPKFLYGVVSNQNFVETVTANSVGVSYPAITSTEFSTIPIWLPPSREDQQQIADSIEGQTSKIDKLIGHIEKQIKLLQEYRTALISEAVTGKIDVR